MGRWCNHTKIIDPDYCSYHGAKDPRLPDSFRCFECRLRNTQASLVKGETLIMEYVLKYAELALFRCVPKFPIYYF